MRLWTAVICCIIVFITDRVLASSKCYLKDMKVTCEGTDVETISNLHVDMDHGSVYDLTISNSFLPIISKTTFQGYTSMHTLRLENTRTESIEDGAFSDLKILRNLYILDNQLTEFNFDVLSTPSSLNMLDLTNNLITDLQGYNITLFPTLTVVNISQNRLEYLPVTIIDKLKESNTFAMMVDSNPWNCSHPIWSQQLDSVLVAAFCSITQKITTTRENSEITTVENSKTSTMSTPEIMAHTYLFTTIPEDSIRKPHTRSISKDSIIMGSIFPQQCRSGFGLIGCMCWLAVAIGFGVFLGNICVIKQWICRSHKRREEASLDCNKSELQQMFTETG